MGLVIIHVEKIFYLILQVLTSFSEVLFLLLNSLTMITNEDNIFQLLWVNFRLVTVLLIIYMQ